MLSAGSRIASAFRLLFTGRLPADVVAKLAEDYQEGEAGREAAPAAAAPASAAEDRGDRAVQLLALLQREGRLVDFLREDLSAYSDAQVGAAVRDVHAKTRAALDRYMTIGPLSEEDEGEPREVSADTDPSTIRIVGNVPAQGTARGIVRHRGWRVTRLDLPPLPQTGRDVVAPAEVEVN
ncbi:MAG TPA: DUF2760 domain-containing protein [Vicinamibacterales bacterium]